jgi:hypothetical protein
LFKYDRRDWGREVVGHEVDEDNVSYHTSLRAADYFCLIEFDGFFFWYDRSSRALELGLSHQGHHKDHTHNRFYHPNADANLPTLHPFSSPSLHLDERDIATASIYDVLTADVRGSAVSESLFWTGRCCANVAGAAASSALIDAWTNLKEEETNDDMILRKHFVQWLPNALSLMTS